MPKDTNEIIPSKCVLSRFRILPIELIQITACNDLLPHFLPFPGRCVRADPAAVFAALLAFGSRSTLLAAVAARLLVTSLLAFFDIHAPRKLKIKNIYEFYIH